jgi:uncharacterized protein with FMN-binding domain
MQPSQFGNPNQKKISPAIISIIAVVLIAIAAGTVYAVTRPANDQATNTTDTSQTANTAPTTETTETPSTTTTYKDGSYTATGTYSTPGGNESVTVTVTLTGDKITAIETTGSGTGGNSKQYQSQFLSGYKAQVIGKAIEEVSLSRVAGSSLTSGGFNRAIDTIQNDARNS